MSKIDFVSTASKIADEQVKNNSGAYVFKVSPIDRLRRFLVLGVTGGTYYQSERQLTYENAKEIVSLIASDGPAVVQEVVDFAKAGRAPKADPGLFVLALCTVVGDQATRSAAYNAVNQVCRIPTHLFTFVEYCEGLSKQLRDGKTGWGRGRRNAVASWYNGKDTKDLVYHVTKYKQRNGWSNRDLLRLGHVKPSDHDHDLVYKFVTQGELTFNATEVSDVEAFDRLVACDQVLRTESEDEVVSLITQYGLVREHIPTQWLKSKKVWEALLPGMPLNALIRNVGRLTSVGLLDVNGVNTKLVIEKLLNEKALKKARVHPYNVLVAYNQYRNGGEGGKGSLRWAPIQKITNTLNEVFYKSFEHVEPAGKRFYIGVDVSGSMSYYKIPDSPLTCAMGAAAMAMTIARTEPMSHIMAFNNGIQDLKVTRNESLESVHAKVNGVNFGGTDCSLPMVDAFNKRLEVDTFIVITDNETNSGRTHPSKALQQYRDKMGIDAKLVVIGMTATGFTIADPNDKGMLDVVGFDSNAPRIIRDFSAGSF